MNKNKQKNVSDRFTELLNIPKEIVADIPKLVLSGNKEVFIENYKGLIVYTDTNIKINSKDTLIHIVGESLNIKVITSEELIISGNIISINFSN